MSIYQSIANSSAKLKRRLIDENIRKMGREVKILRIQGTEDIFQDLSHINELSKNVIDVIIKFPTEIPLDRYRADFDESVEETRVFFFDLLPIEAFTKFSDHVEKRDLLFFTLEDEMGNNVPFLLQVTEIFGSFGTSLVYKKLYLAPQHGALNQSILSQLNDYYTMEEPDALVRAEAVDPDANLVRERRISKIMGD